MKAVLAGFRSESHFVAASAVALLSTLCCQEQGFVSFDAARTSVSTHAYTSPGRFRFPASTDLPRILSDFIENPTVDSDVKRRSLSLIDALAQDEVGRQFIKVGLDSPLSRWQCNWHSRCIATIILIEAI